MDDNLFAEATWEGQLSDLLEEHELDQLSGIGSDMLAEYLTLVADALAKLVKFRDRGMPGALSAVERAELAALRKVNKLQAELIIQFERTRLRLDHDVTELKIKIKEADG